jgi:putative endonuclease
MSIQQDHGKWGEQHAVEFLNQHGLIVLHQNWRYKKAEIDIIAKENDILVFVEVKTRSSTQFGTPEEKVNKRKQQLIIDAAMSFMRSEGYEDEIRFDIISVLGSPDRKPEISHFRDAWFPGLDYK